MAPAIDFNEQMAQLKLSLDDAGPKLATARMIIHQKQSTLKSEQTLLKKVAHNLAESMMVEKRIKELKDGIEAQKAVRDQIFENKKLDQGVLTAWEKRQKPRASAAGRGKAIKKESEAMDVEENMSTAGPSQEFEVGTEDSEQILVATSDAGNDLQEAGLNTPGVDHKHSPYVVTVKREATNISPFDFEETAKEDRPSKRRRVSSDSDNAMANPVTGHVAN